MSDVDKRGITTPDSIPQFRRAQLLLLLAEFDAPLTIERIGYLDFFAANPHLVIREGPSAVRLELSGFSPATLTYQSAPERYANRRSRLRSDLAALTAWGYALPTTVDGRIGCSATDSGRESARSMISLYADSYRQSVELLRPLFKKSDKALAESVQTWLMIDDFRVDLLDLELESLEGLEPQEESL